MRGTESSGATLWLISRSVLSGLDLGCGQGALVRLCHTSGYPETYGVDWSQEQIELGQRAGISNLRVAGALEALRDASEPFDVVFACDFLEHLSRETLTSGPSRRSCCFGASKASWWRALPMA